MARAPRSRLYLITDERRGAYDGYLADRALADVRHALDGEGAGLAVHTYHAADCDVATLAEAIETPSLFGARTLVVVRGAESFDERAQLRLTEALERQATQVTVVLLARSPDMRRRLFVRCRDLGQRITVDHPRPDEMPAWVERLAQARRRVVDDDARDLLLDCVGRDLLRVASELDKLVAAVPAPGRLTVAHVARIVAAGREHGNFEVADAVCARDGAAAARLLARALDEGAQPVALVGALAASLRPIAAGTELVARGRRPEDAARDVGVAPYQRRAFLRGVRAYRPREVRRALGGLARLDVAAKTGGGDARALLESWVLALCARGRAGAGSRSPAR